MRTAIEVLHFSPIAGLSQRPRRRRRLAAAVVALAAVMVLLVQPAAADTYTWDVGGARPTPMTAVELGARAPLIRTGGTAPPISFGLAAAPIRPFSVPVPA